MASVIKTVTWDCDDALVLARFWAAVLGSDVDEDSTRDKAYVEAAGWGAPNMWFNRVPEGNQTVSRTGAPAYIGRPGIPVPSLANCYQPSAARLRPWRCQPGQDILGAS